MLHFEKSSKNDLKLGREKMEIFKLATIFLQPIITAMEPPRK